MNKKAEFRKGILRRTSLIVIALLVCVSLVAAYPSTTKIPIGSFCGVTAYSNGPMYADTTTGNGNWQCVEYVKRFYLNAMWIDTSGWSGNAYTYYSKAPGRGLNAYPNGGSVPPASGDIFVYGGGKDAYGHVAIVTAVRSNSIDVIEQNVNPTNGFRTIARGGGNRFADWGSKYPLYVIGWVHAGPIVAVTSPMGGNYWPKWSSQKVQYHYRTDLGMTYAKIDLISTSGTVIPIAACVPLSYSGVGSYSMIVTQLSGQYRVRVTLSMGSGPQYSATSDVFYIQ